MFRQVAAARQAALQALTSVQGRVKFSMSNDYTRVVDDKTPAAMREMLSSHGLKTQQLDKTITFGRAGEKHFDTEVGTENSTPLGEYSVTFDGQTGRMRIEGQGMVSMGRSEASHKPGTPEPQNYLETFAPSDIMRMLEQGQVKLISGRPAEVQGKPVLQFVFQTLKNTPGSRTEVSYSVDEGYQAIRTRHFDPDGVLLTEQSGEIGHFNVDGNDVFYPLVVREFGFKNGQAYHNATMTVDKASLIFNARIPESSFVMVPRHDEWVWDNDLQQVVVDQGKQIDMRELSPTPTIRSGQPSVESEPASKGDSVGVQETPPAGRTKPIVLLVLAGVAIACGVVVVWRGGMGSKRT